MRRRFDVIMTLLLRCVSTGNITPTQQPQEIMFYGIRFMSNGVRNICKEHNCIGRSLLAAAYCCLLSLLLIMWGIEYCVWQYMMTSWWKTISASLAIGEGTPSFTDGFLHKSPVMRNFALWLIWTNCWVKSRLTGDLRRHYAHVTPR